MIGEEEEGGLLDMMVKGLWCHHGFTLPSRPPRPAGEQCDPLLNQPDHSNTADQFLGSVTHVGSQ